MKGRKVVLLVAVSAMMATVLLSGCSGDQKQADAKKVASIYVDQEPTRMEYLEGESFDPTGAKIDATLQDGTVVENVAYGVTAADPLTAKGYKVTFTYEGQSVSLNLNITRRGNAPEYYVENTPVREDSPLAGNTYFFLGSSVTRGEHSDGESMVEFIAKRNGSTCVKEAVSGTTLMDNGEKSYVQRFDRYLEREDRLQELDAFICQLSTNDIKYPDSFGSVTDPDKRALSDFDITTSAGAMEYIIVKARETWDCPVLFYTNSNFANENYEKLLVILDQIAEKWDVEVIDLYRDAAFNDVTTEDLDLYMADRTHPTRAGYRDWWTPKFEQKLEELESR